MSAQLLQTCFWFGGSKLSIIPLKGSSVKNGVRTFEVLILSPLVRYIWCTFLIISLLVTLFDLYHSFSKFETLNLARIVYHFFILLVKTASTIIAFVLNQKCSAICKLLNSLSPQNIQKSKLNMFTIFLSTSTFGVGIFYLVIIPLFALAFPCTHNTPLVPILFSDCASLAFRVAIVLTQFSFMLPVSAMGTICYSIVLITLSELAKHLENLW